MIRKHSPVLAALALAAACTANPWKVDSFEAPEANLAARRSFTWRAGDLAAPVLRRPEVKTEAETRIRAAITDELARKGYAEAPDAAGADMVVTYQIAGSRRYVESDSSKRVGAPSPNEVLTPGGMPMPAASEVPREKSVREGTVVVFAEDPASGRLVWRGLVTTETGASSSDATIRHVVDIARHIAQQFPARRAAP
jgi:hypothetical protein